MLLSAEFSCRDSDDINQMSKILHRLIQNFQKGCQEFEVVKDIFLFVISQLVQQVKVKLCNAEWSLADVERGKMTAEKA